MCIEYVCMYICMYVCMYVCREMYSSLPKKENEDKAFDLATWLVGKRALRVFFWVTGFNMETSIST